MRAFHRDRQESSDEKAHLSFLRSGEGSSTNADPRAVGLRSRGTRNEHGPHHTKQMRRKIPTEKKGFQTVIEALGTVAKLLQALFKIIEVVQHHWY